MFVAAFAQFSFRLGKSCQKRDERDGVDGTGRLILSVSSIIDEIVGRPSCASAARVNYEKA